MKIGYIIGGILLALFGIGQVLQLIGLIGAKGNIASLGFAILGGLGSFACFQKVFAKPSDTQ